MAIDYDINPQRDLDDGTYAALPGTTPGEYVQQHTTPMKGRMRKDAEGCHPSRWIHELLNNKFTTCDLFDRARAANLNPPYAWQHTHRLMINGNQSFCSNTTRLLSSVCLDCHFHFVFKMAWEEEHAGQVCSPRQARWPVRDAQFPWHHLVWAGSDTEMNLAKENSKYYPILAREYFVCSAPPCTFQVTLEISEPRMASWWIDLLLDHDTIRQTLRLAKEEDPERYAVATDDWAEQAPMNLNTYLKNLLEATSPEKPRSISKRNKRFSVLFGPRCFSIFRELEFEETVDEQDGVDGGSFTPPLPSPPGGPFGATEIGTYRGFVEDVRSEVQCIIHRRGEPAELCTPGLHADLGCVEVNNTNDSHLVNIRRYTLLGVLPNQPKEIVVNAYKRQWELLPNKRKELIDALMGIANDLNDEQLADYAATQSSVFDSQLPTQSNSDDDGVVSQALAFLGLQPPNKYNAETLVSAFRQKLSQEPKMANSARQMLLLIAQASTDDTYQAILLMEANGKMSVATAKAVLGMKEDSSLGPEVVAATRTKIALSNDKEEKATYLDALEAIADLTNAMDLKQLVATQRQENGIEIPKGSSVPDASGRPANYDLPVGLENIGNTCYLNSLLQYLFTVKPVRDIALNYENFKLELNDESIKQRLLGGNKMQMDRGEAVVAQAFAQELSDLFNNLETSDKVATRPSQRLANAVLLSTHTLLNDSKSAEPVAGPKPPPLPARPPPEPPAKSSGDVEMANGAVKEERDPVDTASTVSSQTLVEDGSDHSYEKVEVPSAATDDQTTDTVMALEEGDSPADTVRPSLKSTETSETIIKGADGTADGEQNADVSMADADEPQTVDSKVLTALEHQKRSSGTDQQDVEEVMGSILNRLQAAIRPSSVDESTGIQLEKIMETFFVTTINYTKKFDDKTYQKEISFDRSITAFPAPEGSCSLYDALGRNFDQQIIEESKLSRYTAIKTLPPVLHVLIQRSQSMGSKNGNPVEIPETLYLDRYMDAPHDSPTFQQRVQSWAVASRISDLKAQKARVEAVIPTGPFLESCGEEEPTPIVNSAWAEDDTMEDGVLDFEKEENWDFDGPVDDDFLLVSHPTNEAPPTTKAPVKPQGIESAERNVREMMSNELRQREEDLEKHHAGLKNIPYRLHAVICHRGQLMSGHYWVWIHDFEQDVWRKYNDSNVDVKRNTDEVLATLSTSGEPYFLCYVRDEDKDAYVNVPRRQRPEQTTDADGDVVVANSEPTPEVKHTQDFSPPFGPQKSD
ncbi:ubiquitin-specific protease ubp2 [Fusarium falciforme]|nr:ubiquitin-specific protease ubp2 [Fusarium falciforme]KAJ4209177.1 ubiquitin-specific protease ubp2 [Fusarium falciforme]